MSGTPKTWSLLLPTLAVLVSTMLSAQETTPGGNFIETILKSDPPKAGVWENPGGGTEFEAISGEAQVSPQIAAERKALWTPANRAALPGDKIEPPSGSIGDLANAIRGEFGVTMKNGKGTWSLSEMRSTYRVLKTLPLKFRNCTTSATRQGLRGTIKGWTVRPLPNINLTDRCAKPGVFQRTFVHEMTHCFQYRYPEIMDAFSKQFWPGGRMKSRSVSAYGNSKDREDMAECVKFYWADGAAMQKSHPDRYEFVKKFLFEGVEFRP